MPITIVATAGAADANSFVTLVEAQAFLDARLNASTWEAATPDSKNRALVEATRDLSALSWVGYRADDVQALSWPRQYAPNPDVPNDNVSIGESGYVEFATTEIPQRVKDATCELAFQYLKAGTSDVAALDATTGIISKTVGPLSTTYAEPHQRPVGLARYPRVMAYIRPLLAAASQGGLTVVRV